MTEPTKKLKCYKVTADHCDVSVLVLAESSSRARHLGWKSNEWFEEMKLIEMNAHHYP